MAAWVTENPTQLKSNCILPLCIALYQVFLMGISGLELGTLETFTFQIRQMDSKKQGIFPLGLSL